MKRLASLLAVAVTTLAACGVSDSADIGSTATAGLAEYGNTAAVVVPVDQLPASVNEDTGRVHTHYSQAWTATGRMQSNDPNLQTIPVRKERGREIRAASPSGR